MGTIWIGEKVNIGGKIPAPASGGGGGSITVVNAWKKQNTDGATSDTVTVAPTAGNALVVEVIGFGDSHTGHAVTDNIGGATGWTKIGGETGTGGNVASSLWAKFSLPAGVATVTVNSGTGNYPLGIVHEVSGITTFTAGEVSSVNTSSVAGVYLTSALVNATANSILFASIASDSGNNPATLTINSTGSVGTWALFNANSSELNGSLGNCGSVVYQIVSSSASRAHGWASSDTTSPTALIIAAFH